MNAKELIARAQALCRALGRPFPTEVKAYAWDWQRQRYDLAWCWGIVKSALKERRALWQTEVEVRRHHDQLQRDRDAKDLKAGEPLAPTPRAGQEPWWETPSPEQDTQSPQQNLPSSASPGGVLDDLDGHRPCAEPRQTCRARRQPYRKRSGTKAAKVRELLRAHVVRRGPAAALKLERMAKNEGLLEEDQTISRCSTFRRVMRELNIESRRIGFGRGAEYVWRLKPPSWTRGLDVYE
jgi:hypothetical protein